MTVNKLFVLLCFLVTSGFLLCTSLQIEKQLKTLPIMNRVIGIHLGMTYSSVALYKDDTMEVVKNEQGSKFTPSCVSFTEDSRVLIGEPAKAQQAVNPERTVCGVTRLIGRTFDDSEVQSYIKTLPYKVVNKENKPCIELQFKNGETKLFIPEEICAMILGKMKEMAETYIEQEVEYAVILIHQSYMDNEIRRNIHEACGMAGLKIAYTVGAYGAVALAHSRNQRSFFKALVYDLGSTGFNATLVDVDEEGVFLSTAAKGDAELGGQTFNTRLVDHFINLIKSKYDKDVSSDLNALLKLRTECERAKISLSSNNRATIKLEIALVDDHVLLIEEALTRETFEELNVDLFNQTIDLVKAAIEEEKLEKMDIDEIILVGGSTQIPLIQHLVKSFFGKDPVNAINPQEALARAATQLAGEFVQHYVPYAGYVNSVSVGIETIGGVMTRFVDVLSRVPYKKSRRVTTYYDGQTTIEIKVFEGQRRLTKYCHYLGDLQISGLPPAPRGVTSVEVTLKVHEDGGILVTVEHKPTQNKKSMIISGEERIKGEEKVRQDYWEFEENYEEDKKVLENIRFAMSLYQPQPHSMSFAAVPQV